MKPAQLTDDELIDSLRSADKSETAKIKAEIERRIKRKNNEPHPEECLCMDCIGQE